MATVGFPQWPRQLGAKRIVTATQWRTPEICSGERGGSTNSVEDRQNGDLGAVAPLVRGSGGSGYLVQVISFQTVKFS